MMRGRLLPRLLLLLAAVMHCAYADGSKCTNVVKNKHYTTDTRALKYVIKWSHLPYSFLLF
jgi:hypothetical protein